jgi:hypothetical protein
MQLTKKQEAFLKQHNLTVSTGYAGMIRLYRHDVNYNPATKKNVKSFCCIWQTSPLWFLKGYDPTKLMSLQQMEIPGEDELVTQLSDFISRLMQMEVVLREDTIGRNVDLFDDDEKQHLYNTFLTPKKQTK